MLNRPAITRPGAAMLTLAATVLLACGGTSAEAERERLTDDLVAETDGALDDETARCVADALYEEFGDDSFEQVVEAAADRDADTDDAVRLQVIDIFAGCDALEPIIDDTP